MIGQCLPVVVIVPGNRQSPQVVANVVTVLWKGFLRKSAASEIA